jgi:carboxyl-terminal processing protease
VLDLRGNGGGLLNHATGIAGLFIDRGPVVQVRGADSQVDVLGDDEAGLSFGGELIVMVDRFSASASEILAGALQDYRRALILGTSSTHGKGTVQALVDLDRMGRPSSAGPLGVVKLTIQQFFLVDGESTQWRGVVPDIVLPDPASHVESGERYLDDAIPWSKVDPLPATTWSKAKWQVDVLQSRSKERTAKEPVFAKIDERGAFLRARRDDTEVPLSREAWTARREKERAQLETLDPKLDEGPKRFSVQLLDYRPQAESPATREAAKTSIDRWTDGLAHDPWLEEALHLIDDMRAADGQKSKK